MPLPILAISAVASLIKEVPALFKIFGDDAPPPVIEKIAAIASSIAGEADPGEAVNQLKANPDLMMQFKDAADKRALEIIQIHLADVQSARSRDVEIQKIRGNNTRADALVACCVIGIITCILIACFMPSLSEFGKTAVNVALGAFLGTWAQVNNFEFGSTKVNKEKDHTIAKLTETAGG